MPARLLVCLLVLSYEILSVEHARAQAKSESRDTLIEPERTSPPDAGWTLELSAGYVDWGEESRRGSGSLLAETALGYTTRTGLDGGLVLSASAAELLGVATLARVGYNLDHSRVALPFAAFVFGGPKVRLEDGDRFDSYSGWQYGGEVQFRPRIGARRHAQALIGLGFQTLAERRTTSWEFGSNTRKTIHSGLRLRLGVVL